MTTYTLAFDGHPQHDTTIQADDYDDARDQTLALLRELPLGVECKVTTPGENPVWLSRSQGWR